MQPGGRFVNQVEHVDQIGSESRCKGDASYRPIGKRGRGLPKREITEIQIGKHLQSPPNPAGGGLGASVGPRQQLLERLFVPIGDRAAVQLHGQGVVVPAIMPFEQAWLRRRERSLTAGTIKPLIEDAFLRISQITYTPLAATKAGIHRFRQALHRRLANLDAIEQDPNVLTRWQVRQVLIQAMNGAARLDANVAFLKQPREPDGLIRNLVRRGDQADRAARPRRQCLQRGDDIGRATRFDVRAAGRANHRAGPRKQETQMIAELRQRRDRGVRRFLVWRAANRDGGQQIADLLGVGLLEALQKLPGVRGEALQIAALGLGIERVENEAALARPADAGDDGQPAQRNRDVDALQVVYAYATERERLCSWHEEIVGSASSPLGQEEPVPRRRIFLQVLAAGELLPG